jgi:hypothetical protein
MGADVLIVLLAFLVQLPAQPAPDVVVQELREFSSPIGRPMRSDGKPVPFEARRTDLYRRIAALGTPGVQAMARALTDGDAPLRKGAALALNVMGGGWFDGPKVDIRPALPALTTALGDTEEMVRAWSAQAIATIKKAP